MKAKIIFLLLFFPLLAAKADTISSWKVFYNTLKIKHLTEYTKNEIEIKTSSYKTAIILAFNILMTLPVKNAAMN